MAVEGFLEHADAQLVLGWCYDRSHPSQHLSVELHLDGQVAAVTTAAAYRSHLASAGIGQGDHGFSFHLPVPLQHSDLNRLAVLAASAEGRLVVLPWLSPPAHARQAEPAQPPQHGLVSRRLPRCILHIGMEKTGTTSLQNFLGLNRAQLQARGILAPRALAQQPGLRILNHLGLATYALDAGNDSEPLRTQWGAVGPNGVAAHRAMLAAALAREVTADGAGCHTLLLSNEHCQSRLRLPEELTRLRHFLLSFCEDVHVILYLRPQHQVEVSARSTLLRNGAVAPPLLAVPDKDSPAAEALRRAYDYDALVTRWEAAFGSLRLDVRLFPLDVVSDFFAHLGVDTAGFVPLPGRLNASLDAAAERVLAALNRPLALLGGPDSRRVRDALIEALDATHGGRGALPSRQDAEAFQRQFDAGNERLRQRRFPGRATLFEDDFSAYGEASALVPPSVEEMAALFVDVLRHATAHPASGDGTG